MSQHPPKDGRVELHDFADQLDLSAQQVRDELAAGRLSFAIDEGGVIYTDAASILDWIGRRVGAVALFGQNGISFPMFPADWRDREHVPGPILRGTAVKQEERQPAEAENE